MYHKIANVEKIIKVFTKLGFSDAQILKLVSNKKPYIKRFAEIEDAFQYYKKEMLNREYTEEEIYALATNYPAAIFYRFYHGCMKKEYISYIENYRQNKNDDSTNLDLPGVTKVLKSVGISQKKLDDIYTFNSPILWMSIRDLKDNIKYQMSCNITREQLKINVNNYPRILELGKKNYHQC